MDHTHRCQLACKKKKKINQVKSPSPESRVPETSSDSPIGSNRESGRDNFSSELRLLFLVALYVTTSVLGRDHFSFSTALTLGRDFLFLVATWIFDCSVLLQVAT